MHCMTVTNIVSLFSVPEIMNVTVTPHYSRMNNNAADILSTLMVEFQREPVSCHGHCYSNTIINHCICRC